MAARPHTMSENVPLVRLWPLVLALLVACDGCDEPAAPAPSATASAPASAAADRAWTFVATGARDFRVAIEGDRTFAHYGDEFLRGAVHEGVRRYTQNDEVVARVELRGAAFQVKDRDASPVWSVRREGAAIWIEGTGGPFVIQESGDDGLRVFARGTSVGTVTRAGDRLVGKRGVEPVFEVEGAPMSPALGVALLEAIPPIERHVIMAELAARR
jgi:hypothetical protein